jgi:hypothetical protein
VEKCHWPAGRGWGSVLVGLGEGEATSDQECCSTTPPLQFRTRLCFDLVPHFLSGLAGEVARGGYLQFQYSLLAFRGFRSDCSGFVSLSCIQF